MTVKTQAELFATTLEKQWETIKNAKKGLFSSNIDFIAVTKFIIGALDDAIMYAENTLTAGVEKKEFVLTVISRLYDTTISTNLPLWTYPFSSTIKNVVINIVISNAIDWIVTKYNTGSWRPLKK